MAAPKTHWTKGPNADEIRAKIAERARLQHERQRTEGYVPKRGWKHSAETRERMSEAVKRRDIRGERNPFYGREHTAETKAKLSDALSGRGNGTGYLPYGPEFNRRFKRLIRDRDGQRCQRCGLSREDHGRTLDVHHIDNDPFNNAPENLVAVCKSCHVWLTWDPTRRFDRLDQLI